MNHPAAAGPTGSAATPTARVKGPRVWLDMDQPELDDAYHQPTYAANILQVMDRFASASRITRERLGAPVQAQYGPTPIERLFVFRSARPKAPLHIHIHGGAWRARPASDYMFPAEVLVRAGAHYVVPDFTSVDQTGGDLVPMVEQVRRAIAWTAQNAEALGGDIDRMYLSGFSSGGHLASLALLTDWAGQFGLPADLLKGAVLCSGIYDLEPVRLSARSRYVNIPPEIEQNFSAQRHLAQLHTPLVLAHGTHESPEFQRQTQAFAAALRAAGKPVELLLGENFNHFEMMETFGNPYGLLGRAVLEQMGPGASQA
jgi:arylformamidase